MEYIVSGVIERIEGVETKGNLTYQRFAIDLGGEYPQVVMFQASRPDVIAELAKYTTGNYVTLIFSLRGRVWENKVYNTLNCYAISNGGVSAFRGAAQRHEPAQSPVSQEGAPHGSDVVGPGPAASVPGPDDDLPF